MVNNVAHTTRIDKQGRLIIPAEIRKKLSLDEGSVIEIKQIADQLILRKMVQTNGYPEQNIDFQIIWQVLHCHWLASTTWLSVETSNIWI